jgi:hypothetical protein
MSDVQPTRLSDKLSGSIAKLYKIGGLGLVFIFIGVLTMIFAFIYPKSTFSIPLFVIGSLLVTTSFVLFVLIRLKALLPAKRTLLDNKETIDEIQDLAITLTKLTYNTQSYCFKNIDKIKGTVDSVIPIVKPFLGEKAQKVVLKIEDVSSGIVEYSEAIERVIADTKEALEKGDFKILSKYRNQVDDINKKLQLALKKTVVFIN